MRALPTDERARRTRHRLDDRTLRRLAWVAFACVPTVFAAAAVVEHFDPVVVRSWTDTAAGSLLLTLAILSFPTVGLLIIRRQPRNPIGWLLQSAAVLWTVVAAEDVYAQLAFHLWPGRLPLAGPFVAVGSGFWWPAVMVLAVFTVLLFPDGRLPSPAWRWFAVAAGVVAVVGPVVLALAPGPVGDVVVLDPNPLAVSVDPLVVAVVQAVVFAALPVTMILASISLVSRFRRGSPVERLQLKWLMSAVVFIASTFALSILLGAIGIGKTPSGTDAGWVVATEGVAVVSFGLVPVTIGIAITRHGLYGIDRLISRALVVGALGVFITAVYVGIVVGVGSLAGTHQPSVLLSVLATAVVAIAFQPVREAVTAGVNRLVYGSRATPYEVLADFAADMAGTYTTAELLPRITQTVSQSLDDATVEVWLVTGTRLERADRWPADDPNDVTRLSVDGIDLLHGDRVVPVRHRDELLGALTVTRSSGEPVTPTEEELLVHVASQTGLVLRNLRLVEDLQSSRERLVSMQDRQRRRLERDLHDGAQQSLVAITLMLRMASRLDDPDALAAAATSASEQLQSAVAELRELARGLHPAILTERGTPAALTALAERCPVPVRIDSSLRRRLPAPVEGALYFVAAESLTNVARYAQARSVQVILRDEERWVSLEIVDDGIGGADATRGTGLLGLSDRVAVVDGTFEVGSPPGRGTRIRCEVPVPAPAALPRQRGEQRAPQPARSSS